MKTTPVRLRISRRLPALAALAAVTVVTAALAAVTVVTAAQAATVVPPPAKGQEVNVYGRTIRVTTPLRMVLLPVTRDMVGLPYARFAPEAELRRRPPRSFENMPFTAKANAEPEMNRDDSTAVNSIALLRADSSQVSDAPEAEDLRAALRYGLQGRRNLLLTRPPEGAALLERIESSGEAVVDLTSIGKRGDFTLLGSALLLVRGRAVWLRVVRLNPETEGDMVAVREAIVDWVREMREANRPAK